jgi:hypothetical protein
MVKDALIMSPPNTQEEQLSTSETIARQEVESVKSHVQELTPKEDHMRGLSHDETSKQNAVSGTSDKNTEPHPRVILEEFINLVREVKRSERHKQSSMRRNKG